MLGSVAYSVPSSSPSWHAMLRDGDHLFSAMYHAGFEASRHPLKEARRFHAWHARRLFHVSGSRINDWLSVTSRSFKRIFLGGASFDRTSLRLSWHVHVDVGGYGGFVDASCIEMVKPYGTYIIQSRHPHLVCSCLCLQVQYTKVLRREQKRERDIF